MALLLASRKAFTSDNMMLRRTQHFAAPLHRPTLVPSRRITLQAQKQQFASFEDMLNRSELPLLVDFYATWCGPCQMMSPVLSSVASKFKGKLQVVKIDTDKYPAISSQHKVQALPTVALFVGGKIVFRFEGVLSESQLLDKLRYHLGTAST